MRDGAIYFALLLIANSVALGLIKSFTLIQPMSTWIAILTSIMMSRFILDLHEAADPRADRDLSSMELDTLSTTMFPFPTGTSRARPPPFDSVFGASTMASIWFCDDDDTLDDSWEGKNGDDEMSLQQRSDCVEDGRHSARISVEAASDTPRSGADSSSFIWMH
ncbi:hypothetical protein PYCCODRAFT_1105342 [Trametes coccinea BRFM310]|uniref:Uncharacterized protein n=1 Tax=Trametes coccinea (strain BRFM310) TaxID=1353009 RepID=A0A1Y2ID36_TRAC3|nr:hypothetical protein PYCCODRAFT_1105342 [Trametes coccinea BRFM310]